MTENDLDPEPIRKDAHRDADRRAQWSLIGIIGGALALIFLIAVGAGFITALVEADRGPSVMATVFGLMLAVLALAASWVFLRSLRQIRSASSGVSRRDRRNTLFITGLFLFGAVLGAGLSIADVDSLKAGTSLLGSGPLNPTIAIIFALILLIVLPLAYWYYHRHITDELEEAAYREGALLALYGYSIGAPAWWVLWRGGWLPEPDGVTIFMSTMVIWMMGWMWAKYR